MPIPWASLRKMASRGRAGKVSIPREALSLIKEPSRQNCYLAEMAILLFRCPNKNVRVQGWTADDPPDDDAAFAAVECLACRQMHYVNPATGRVLGSTDDDE